MMPNEKPPCSFFQNRECAYFPCHTTTHPEDFNCLFCYCPLYLLGDQCGGQFVILENGVKDCSNCTICHTPEAAAHIAEMFPKIKESEMKNRK